MEYWLLYATERSEMTDGNITGYWLNKDSQNQLQFSKWESGQEVCIWRRACIAIVTSFMTENNGVYAIDENIHVSLVARVAEESDSIPDPPPRRLSYIESELQTDDVAIAVSIERNLQSAIQWSIQVSHDVVDFKSHTSPRYHTVMIILIV